MKLLIFAYTATGPLGDQVRRLEEWATVRGHDVAGVVAGSGVQGGRGPLARRAVEMAADIGAEAVLVERADRVARSHEHFIDVVMAGRRARTRVVALDGSVVVPTSPTSGPRLPG